ncbi:pyridoxamine 5'-phosphate oxidase family protein [Croceivirga thetidis]|uniref:Flavin mononucleotide-binding protein n=1 Tax=Croceivirga thetidis TaxID=2721623 RepID=A0ABX1GNQ2_9FLAO|nr:pyridoxamine 5'-phosphate oxidase family protein [Croceivirga thetidis]NKI31274.1 flavin mononucleotide-binding protein [Croceivirga thetidis]
MVKDMKMDDCLALLARNYIGRLGYIYGQSPFILPITFHHDPNEKCIISYSAEGHKLHAMRQYNVVSFQVDEITSIQNWKSVFIQGRYEEIKGSSTKLYLNRFAEGVRNSFKMRKEEPPAFIKDFSSKLEDRGVPTVYKISTDFISGKFRTS